MAAMLTIRSLKEAALKLQPDDRVQLAHSLVESLGDLTEADLAEIWLREAERRDEEMATGRVQGLDGEEVFEGLKSRYGQ